jgi:putative MATE family efflux protein
MAKDLTKGTPARLILGFAVPLLIGNMFQQLYGIIDTVIVGRTIGVQALAAVGSTGPVMFFIIGFVQAVTAGFSIVTAQHFGAKRMQEVRKSFCVSMALCAVVALALTSVALLFTHGLLRLLQTPEDILEEAYGFIRIIFMGIGASVLFNMLSNSVLALGDSKPPLYFLAFSCLLNIGLELLFILVFGMGVAGASLATVLAQLTSALLCAAYIMRRVPVLHVRRKHWRLTSCDLLRSARIGLPMGFQASIIAVGAIILQWALNTLGTEAVAAFTVARSIDMVAILPMASFGLAMATYVGQNHGAGNTARIRLGVRHCAAMSLSFSVCIALINIFLSPVFIRLFVGGEEAGVIGLAHTFLVINGCMYWLLSLLFIFRFSLQGLGQSLVPTLAGIMELIMRAVAAVFLTRLYGFVGASAANPLAWLGACVPLAAAYVLTMRRLERGAAAKPPEAA